MKHIGTPVFRPSSFGMYSHISIFTERSNQEEPIFKIVQALYKHSKTTSILHLNNQPLAMCLVCKTTLYSKQMEENGQMRVFFPNIHTSTIRP